MYVDLQFHGNLLLRRPHKEAKYCDERVCLSVCICLCVCLSVFETTLHQTFAHVTFGRGSVLLRRRSDKLCTSCFMDGVMFAHKSRLLDVAAQLKRSTHAVLAINCAQ